MNHNFTAIKTRLKTSPFLFLFSIGIFVGANVYAQGNCPVCHGTGICQVCQGKGYTGAFTIQYTNTVDHYMCTNCGGYGANTHYTGEYGKPGNGKCPMCHGTGNVTGGAYTAAPGATGPEQLGALLGNLAGQALVNLLFPSPEQKARQQAQQQAQQQLQQAQQQLQNEVQLLYKSGMYCLKQKNYTCAINEFQLALAKNPNDENIAKSLAFAKQQLKNTGVAAQNSYALTRLLGNAPPDTGKFNFGRSTNSSALNLVNLDSDPNVVDLRGTTKTAVDPALVKNDQSGTITQPAGTKNTLQALDNVLGDSANPDTKGQPNDNAKGNLSQTADLNSQNAVPDIKTQLQNQNTDQVQSVKAIDQALGQTPASANLNNQQSIPNAQTQVQTQNIDNAQSVKAIDQALGQPPVSADLSNQPSVANAQNQAQPQNTDNAQSVKAIDQALGQSANVPPGANSKNSPSDNQTVQTAANPGGGVTANVQQPGGQAATGNALQTVAVNVASQPSNAPLGSIGNPDFDGRVGNAALGKVNLNSANPGLNTVDLRVAGTTVVDPVRVNGSSTLPVITNPSNPGFNAVQSQWAAGICIAAVRQRDSLLKDQMRLTTLKEKFANKISELDKWKNDLVGYKKEANQIQTDLAKESLSDILGTLSDVLGTISGATDFKIQHLTDAKINIPPGLVKLKTYCERGEKLSHILNALQSVYKLTKEQSDDINEQIESMTNLGEVILVTPGLSEEERNLLEATTKTVEGIAKFIVYANDPEKNKDWQEAFRAWAEVSLKPALEVTGIFFPIVGVTVAAASLAERGVNQLIKRRVQQSVDILGNAIDKNFNAWSFLDGKIIQIDDTLTRNNLAINANNKKIKDCPGN